MSPIDAYHPDAARNFAEKGTRLRGELHPTEPTATGGPPLFATDVHVAATLGPDEIESFGPMGQMDYRGVETSRFVPVGDRHLGFAGEDFKAVVSLAEAMQRTSNLREKVSLNAVTDAVVRWLVDPEGVGDDNLPAFVLRTTEALVEERTILVPIHHLSLDEPFQVGRVQLRPISREVLTEWFREAASRWDEPIDLTPAENRWRQRMQGWASAALVIEAERERADEAATWEADRAICALRMFHPAMFDPRFRCHTTILGWENVRRTHRVYLRGEKFETIRDEMEIPPPLPWHLDVAEVTRLQGIGLSSLSDLFNEDRPTPFQSKLIEAVVMYSRSALRPDTSERLLYSIVALETMLLRDASEAIQQNVAERVAFIATKSPERRLQIVHDVKEAYGLRSAFVHHGATVSELEVVTRFGLHVWDFFMTLVRNAKRFATRDELFALVDTLKYR